MTSSERTTGLRAILSLAPAYRAAQRIVGAERFRQIVVDEILRPLDGERILDIGCGTADILEHLPPGVEYKGFDRNPRYIEAAIERFGGRGQFTATSVQARLTDREPPRTMAIALGVLHHLDDDGVMSVVETARASLEQGGRFVSVDPTLVDGQHRVARLVIKNDRGQHVRSPEQLEQLISPLVGPMTVRVRHDLLRIPYSHVIVDATIR